MASASPKIPIRMSTELRIWSVDTAAGSGWPVTGEPLPAAVASDRVRTSVDVRIGFFGDALAIGLARALERGRKTKFVLAFGRQF